MFIPDPNLVFNPERTLNAVLAHIHYFPSESGTGGPSWKGREHTPQVMEALGELFPYTAVFILQEVLSPIVTPFVLFFSLRPKGALFFSLTLHFLPKGSKNGNFDAFSQISTATLV